MHPDVPRWAKDVLEREMTDVVFTDFVVLKDGTVQKLAIGHTPRETFVVQKTPAGGEIYRVTGPQFRSHALTNGNGHGNGNGNGNGAHASLAHASSIPEATCPGCSTTFRYWRENASERPVYCFNCGAAVRTEDAALAGVEENAPRAR